MREWESLGREQEKDFRRLERNGEEYQKFKIFEGYLLIFKKSILVLIYKFLKTIKIVTNLLERIIHYIIENTYYII